MTPRAPLAVHHVDLLRPLPNLDRRRGTGGALVVFWAGDTPLGHDWIAGDELPWSPRHVGAAAARVVTPTLVHRLAHPDGTCPPLEKLAGRGAGRFVTRPLLSRFEGDGTRPSGPTPGVDVIIATRDRPASLHRTLASLARSRTAVASVIVVDNSPARTAEPVVAEHGARYVAEPRGGLSRARNAGVAASAAPVAAFIDDDAEAHPAWLLRLIEPFADPAISVVTGLVLPAELDTDSQVAFERDRSGLNRGYRRVRYDGRFLAATASIGPPVWRIGAGTNMAIRRSALERSGGFDDRLGAGAAGCSEDSELWYRIIADGGVARYEPGAVVFHHHRADERALLAQAAAYLRGHTVALTVQFARHRNWGDLRRALWTLPTSLASGAVRDAWRGRVRRRLAAAELRGYFSALPWLVLAAIRPAPPPPVEKAHP